MSRFAPYREALRTLSARTGSPLPSLVLSFGILHELTAVVPLVAVFYASRTLGVGDAVVRTIAADTRSKESGDPSPLVWGRHKLRGWVEEGDRWAARIGRRYGIFGYEKRKPGEVDNWDQVLATPGHLAGDVANAVVAYGVTKALLPVRIGVSLYFSPLFSRRVLEPLRRVVIRPFRRNKVEP